MLVCIWNLSEMEKHKDTTFRTETSCKELNNIFTYRVLKWDIIKNLLCESIGFLGVLWKSNIQKAHVYLPKISIMGQTVFEILTQLFSEDSIQICLNLTQFITSGTKSNLEGFVCSHQSKTGLVYLRQFAPQC